MTRERIEDMLARLDALSVPLATFPYDSPEYNAEANTVTTAWYEELLYHLEAARAIQRRLYSQDGESDRPSSGFLGWDPRTMNDIILAEESTRDGLTRMSNEEKDCVRSSTQGE